jgi:MtfA peptidase
MAGWDSGWLVIPSAALLLAAGVLLLRAPLLRLVERDARRRETAPIPDRWLAVLAQAVPLATCLAAAERIQLLRASRNLITTRHWEGCGGLTLSADMQLVIAAQACLLVLGERGDPFPGLRDILVYPETFVPRRVCDPRKWIASTEPARPLPELGEAWSQGIIVLSWEAAVRGAAHASDGRNVVLHEFAHELAFERHLIPSIAPRRPVVPDAEAWQRVLTQGYERFCDKIEAHAPTVLDAYGATSNTEFFAVATEAFFERPRELAAEDPALYAQLCAVYRQDPAQRVAARPDSPPTS